MGDIEMNFTDTVNNVKVVFCLGMVNQFHFKENQFASHTKIIDLGNDFRSTKDKELKVNHFVYGLPELNKPTLKNANYIAILVVLQQQFNYFITSCS
jgi:N-acetyl-gamma-glutamyl-phosphate reductase